MTMTYPSKPSLVLIKTKGQSLQVIVITFIINEVYYLQSEKSTHKSTKIEHSQSFEL